MSFDVNFFARDYSIDEPRRRTPDEAATLKRIVMEHGAEGDGEVFIDTEEASAGLAIRNLQPQHCAFIFDVCAATGWVATFALGPDEHVALAVSPFEPSDETVFKQVFAIESVRVVTSVADVQAAIEEAFKSWSDWAGFDEIGQREEQV